MPPPITPNKADDGIERIKRDLEAKWGIRFPQRDMTWSPQQADPRSFADRAQTALQYLYWRSGTDKAALFFALAEFDRHAQAIKSRWVFKPKADSNVLPTSRDPRNFLSRQDELPPEAQEQLMACLYAKLRSSADKLKSGQPYTAPGCAVDESFQTPPSNDTTIQDCPETQLGPPKGKPDMMWTMIGRSIEEAPHVLSVESRAGNALTTTKEKESPRLQRKPSRLHRQAQLPTSWLRSRSEGDPSSQLSDDFQDSQIESLLSEVPLQDAPSSVGHRSTSSRKNQPAVHAPLEDKEVFKTPPTTPPLSPSPMVPPRTRTPLTRDKSVSAPNINSSTSFLKPFVPVKPNPPINQPGRKRSRPEQDRHESPRKASRDSSTSSVLSSVSSFTRVPNVPSYYNKDTAWSFSTDTATSMTSSMTSAPSLTTTPSTSFSSLSRNTSFDRSDDTDTTIRASFLNPKLESPERKTSSVHLTEQLAQRPPFGGVVPLPYTLRPLRQLYEVTRVALSSQLDLTMFDRVLRTNITDYDYLWSSLTSIVAAQGCTMPERSSRAAWSRAEGFKGVALSGGLAFADKPNVFRFTLNPLRVERTYRLARAFGNDRFCILSFPGLSSNDLPYSLRSDPAATRQALTTWLTETPHQFLGRSWRAFLPKPAPMKRGSRLGQPSQANDRFRIHMFAEDGPGFTFEKQVGETDPRSGTLIRNRMTRQQLLEWFMPAKLNRHQSGLKFFARLQLGVSKTIPTVVFNASEIHRTRDARAHNPCVRKLKTVNHGKGDQPESAVMNDGCARISRNAARAIADMLELGSVPCAFQGRFAGAKGMWMVDVLDEKPRATGRGFWIEITDSQQKFEGHPTDVYAPQENRMTFEVHDYVKRLQPSSLSFQLMIILENCGVPPDVFIQILQEDLTTRAGELQVVMESRLRLALWNQQNNPVSKQRSTIGGIEMQGGLPVSNAEKINWFLEHGFETQTCKFLADQLFDAIHSYCLRLEEKMDVNIGQSTFAYMLADPLAVLEENEVQLSFSHAFHDPKSGFDQTMLHDIDVLVARLPAHLPSDVQRVRAVFKPELRIYRDAIVFPSKGPLSLASKLSGGDFDGDKAWVCWDDRIVKPFKNAPLFEAPPTEAYGISKDPARVADFLDDKGKGLAPEFTRHAFDFNLQYSLLGSCTNYHEAYCYSSMGKPLDHPSAMEIAGLLGLLVDSAKGGFIFDESKWTSYLNSRNLPSSGILKKPAYKDPKGQKPTKHLIDRLVFDVARTVREKALKDFSDRVKDVPQKDPALLKPRNDEYAAAKHDAALASVLSNLESALEIIGNEWSAMTGNRREEENRLRQRSRKTAPDSMSFAAVCENCRTKFLHLAPTITSSGPESTSPVASDRISEWQRKHQANESSYWDLLKASVLFSKWQGKVAWYTAGIELGEIKATSEGRGTYRVVCDEIFAASKIDSKYVDRVRRSERTEERGDDDVDGDDDNDEFGSMAWMHDL